MLIAAENKKLKRKLELHEDEITSCVFGAMQLLPVEPVWEIFSKLAKSAGVQNYLPKQQPDKAEFEFWCKWETAGRFVEPDVVIHFLFGGSPILHCIIEVKWGAKLAPPCELIRQWNHRPKEKDLAPWVHLYLVKNSATGKEEVRNTLSTNGDMCEMCREKKCNGDHISYRGQISKEKEWPLGCVGWFHFVAAVGMASAPVPLWWGEGVPRFFANQNVIPFTGFEKLCENTEIESGKMLFFARDHWWEFDKYWSMMSETWKLSTEMLFFYSAISWWDLCDDLDCYCDRNFLDFFVLNNAQKEITDGRN